MLRTALRPRVGLPRHRNSEPQTASGAPAWGTNHGLSKSCRPISLDQRDPIATHSRSMNLFRVILSTFRVTGAMRMAPAGRNTVLSRTTCWSFKRGRAGSAVLQKLCIYPCTTITTANTLWSEDLAVFMGHAPPRVPSAGTEKTQNPGTTFSPSITFHMPVLCNWHIHPYVRACAPLQLPRRCATV